MEDARAYVTIFLASLPFFLISLFVPFLQTVYLLAYFFFSIGFLFVDELIPEDPQRSTVTQYQRASRFNTYNYILSAGLVISAIIAAIVPAPRHLVGVVIWGASAAGVYYFTRYYGPKLIANLIGDYLSSQMTGLTATRASEVAKVVLDDPTIESAKIASQFKLTAKEAENAIFYVNRYIENNLA